jgi:(p)ppGpp synthase/HD superfamily hydrolase
MQNNQLESLALKLAGEAHFDQTDKGEQSYIWHPLRIAVQMVSTEERIVATLHDVVEDTYKRPNQVTLQDIHATFGAEIMYAVDALTRRETGMIIPISAEEAKAKSPLEMALGYSMWKVYAEPNEEYFEYLKRLAPNPLARKIKFADLADNLNLCRISEPDELDRGRIERYEKAVQWLTLYELTPN